MLQFSFFIAVLLAILSTGYGQTCQQTIFSKIMCFFDGNDALLNCQGYNENTMLVSEDICSSGGTGVAGFNGSDTCDWILWNVYDTLLNDDACSDLYGTFGYDSCDDASDCGMFTNHTGCVRREMPDESSIGFCTVECDSDADCPCDKVCRMDGDMTTETGYPFINHPAGSVASGMCVNNSEVFDYIERSEVETSAAFWNFACFKNEADEYCAHYLYEFGEGSTLSDYCPIVTNSMCCWLEVLDFVATCPVESDDLDQLDVLQICPDLPTDYCNTSNAEVDISFTCSPSTDATPPSWINSGLVLAMVLLSLLFV